MSKRFWNDRERRKGGQAISWVRGFIFGTPTTLPRLYISYGGIRPTREHLVPQGTVAYAAPLPSPSEFTMFWAVERAREYDADKVFCNSTPIVHDRRRHRRE